MRSNKLITAGVLTLVGLTSGCRIITAGVVTVAAVVGLAGYAVYKTGDVAVTGVGKAAKATGSAVSSGSKSMATVIFYNGEFQTEYAQDLRAAGAAANRALRMANFTHVRGSFDALSGELTAQTQDGKDIVIKMKSTAPQSTEARIRVGVTGDMQAAEFIHGLILRQLPVPAAKEVQP